MGDVELTAEEKLEMREYRIQQRREQYKPQAREFVATFLNSMDQAPAEMLVQVLKNEHRTLVQTFMRQIVVPFIVAMAADYEQGRYDLRDEATCRLCHEMMTNVGSMHLPMV